MIQYNQSKYPTKLTGIIGCTNLAHIPIPAMMANAFMEDELAILEAGMQAHIAKPVDVNHLLKTLASVLRKR